jgi:hypothetical protein
VTPRPLADTEIDDCFPPPIRAHVVTLPRWQSRTAIVLLAMIAALVAVCALELDTIRRDASRASLSRMEGR